MGSSYVIAGDTGLVLFDAGFPGHGRKVLRAVRGLGRDPGEIRLAVVSHGHADHFGGLAEVRDAARAAGSTLDVLSHPVHAAVVAAGDRAYSPGVNLWGRTYIAVARRVLPHLRLPGAGEVTASRDGMRLDAWGLAATLLHTPGHSGGCLSLLLDDGTAFVGDLIHGRRLPVLAPEPSAMAEDRQLAFEHWRRLLEAGARRFMPAHGVPFAASDLIAAMRRLGVPLPRGVEETREA